MPGFFFCEYPKEVLSVVLAFATMLQLPELAAQPQPPVGEMAAPERWAPPTRPWAQTQGQYRVFEIRTEYEFEELPYTITSRVLERVVVREPGGESIVTVQPVRVDVRTPDQERRTFPNRDDNFRLGPQGEILGELTESEAEVVRYARLVSYIWPEEPLGEDLIWTHRFPEDEETRVPEAVYSARVIGQEVRGGERVWRIQVSVGEMRSEVASTGTVWVLVEGGQVWEAEWEISRSPYANGPAPIRSTWRHINPETP